jgi:hypothetical protein
MASFQRLGEAVPHQEDRAITFPSLMFNPLNSSGVLDILPKLIPAI